MCQKNNENIICIVHHCMQKVSTDNHNPSSTTKSITKEKTSPKIQQLKIRQKQPFVYFQTFSLVNLNSKNATIKPPKDAQDFQHYFMS